MAKSNSETAKNIAKELEELLPNGYVAIVGGGKWTEKAKRELIARIQGMPTEAEDNSKTAEAMVNKLNNENKAKETPTKKDCCCHCCSCPCHQENIEDEDEDYDDYEVYEVYDDEDYDDDDEGEEYTRDELLDQIGELEAENSELNDKIDELESKLERIKSVANDD